MDTARIVVLTIADGAVSGATARGARGPAGSGPSSTNPADYLLNNTRRNRDPLTVALSGTTIPVLLQSNARERAFRRGGDINVTT
jgi:hypothetical protein